MTLMENFECNNLSNGAGCDGDYDVVVVGSGYGGGVAACRMSMAGFKVCVLEKGRRYDGQDFPTDSLKMVSATRMENANLGINFGPKDALFQIHIQDDSLAAVGCGLGGGSLINCGVMTPPTSRARKDPRWPKAWDRDWDKHVASASDMLRVQTVPLMFQNSEIMEGVIGEDYDKDSHNPIKLSMTFDADKVSESTDTTASCVACGNCLSGCPYNAKNSTDRTYLVSAVQAGCTIRTQSEVQYVVRNEDDACKTEHILQGNRHRKWLVFLNEFDYVTSDIVVLSAGVLGTAKILFQSRLRGLAVSEKLGFGFSCNGNNVAYLAGSSAPLNAMGLAKEELSNIPFQDRPGPSISSSFISSLGFSIQSAVVPTAYPAFIFKGITTYGWHSSYLYFYGFTDKLKKAIGLKHGQDMVLNLIGHDDSDGRLTYDQQTNKILFKPPIDRLLPRKIQALHKLGRKLGGILFMSRFRSTSVHLLGGCVASPDASSGVCNPNGQVFDPNSPTGVHPGLYICDASMIPCSVGINPCLTISAVAEHVSKHLVEDGVNYVGSSSTIEKSKIICDSSEVRTSETMRGQVGGMPCTAYLKLRFDSLGGDGDKRLRGRVGGYIECSGIEIGKMFIVRGEIGLCERDERTPYTQYMHYNILLRAASGSRYVLQGRKIMNPFLLALPAWGESTTVHMSLAKLPIKKDTVSLKGKLHISPLALLKSVCALRGGSSVKFVYLLLESLAKTYILQVPRGTFIEFAPKELYNQPYPESTMHEIITEDKFRITCQHWKCSSTVEEQTYPVLLINGYAIESYFLPTEANDLVRSLLKAGHDVLLLHGRVHWSSSSNQFTIDDFGRMDVPAAINKIIELYGESIKVHMVGHCIGGLAIHIALMGGYVSAKHIASLSCTNSSMYFKLNTFSLIKMWLSFLPISMAILGKNTVLPMLQGSAASYKHNLLKKIARLIPRYERCTCDECEVFSGIFGNAFWHENISPAMHYWMNKENLPVLPMAAFPHLRKICNNGFIVDAGGNNAYLIHPERMAVPTLYISGGRTLLVTPETSFLANKYMRMHQPGFRHRRVVVDGFGHSDLLIGEESYRKVFPHILEHIRLAENERSSFGKQRECSKIMKEALAWSADAY